MVQINFNNQVWKQALIMVIVNLGLAIANVLMKKVLNEGMDNLTILTYRQAISAIFLAPIAWIFERESKINGHILCFLFFSALIGATLTQYLYLAGLKFTSATFSCGFLNIVSVLTFLLALPIRMEKLGIKSKSGKAKLLGAFVSIGGALVLILYKGIPIFNPQSHHIEDKTTTPQSTSNVKKRIIGSIFLTAGCVFWSSWFLIQEKIGRMYPYRYSSTAILSFFASIQSAILNLIIHRNNAKWIIKGRLHIMVILYSGVVATGLCYVAMAWCVKQRGPVFTATFTPLLQMFVVVLDLCLLHEEIYLGSILGSVLVIFGMYILLWGKSKETEESVANETQENQNDEEKGQESAVNETHEHQNDEK